MKVPELRNKGEKGKKYEEKIRQIMAAKKMRDERAALEKEENGEGNVELKFPDLAQDG